MTGMLSASLMDPMGALITELRADSGVSALVGARVRGGEPAPGDARDPGQYQAFVVLIGPPAPNSRVPISRSSITVRCYGSTFQNATAVWGAVVKALHAVGPRLKGNGLGIYRSAFLEEADTLKDPDTEQPYVEGTIEVTATAQAVT